ncbi:MAG: S8 family serine peptidase [Labilithrix sp.]
MALLRKRLALALAAVALLDVAPARSADPPVARRIMNPMGAPYLKVLGDRAAPLLGTKGTIGALVGLPKGASATDFGLMPVAPGIARLRGDASALQAFSELHPDLKMEIAPPLHLLNDRVGLWTRATLARNTMGADGRGVLVGVADTGLDVTHPDFLNEDGSTRVAWLLDLSVPPGGSHTQLESQFGIKDTKTGQIVTGRVFNSLDIDLLLNAIRNKECDETTGTICAPTDDVGHGTHVMGIAASRGANGYPGVAPKADLIAVRVSAGDSIHEDLLVTGVQFMFDRADFEKKPLVANLSLGSDFGPHDGSFLWEQAIASYVGPDHPGHAIVAAAGNSGSIVEMPIHQTVYVSESTPMLVPIRTKGADSNGQVQVWITLRQGANLKIGLDGPDGTWIAPVEKGHQNAKNTDDYNAGIIYGSNLEGSAIPEGSNGAIVIWAGSWPSGTYNIRLEGKGVAELYLEGLGEVGLGTSKPAVFASAVREGTINLPATHPSIIGVGCTVNRGRWTSITGSQVVLRQPLLDKEGGLPIRRAITPQESTATSRDVFEGEVCNFSSTGPTATGVPKPEIAAPGAMVISAMSRDARPGSPSSVFTSGACPPNKDGIDDKKCLQIDENHGVAEGTSMSSPVVAGVIALLFQQEPTLTQDQLVGLLQAGAHRYRTSTQFDDLGGPGEVDVMGSLDALNQMKVPALHLPAIEQSWIALSSDWVAADGNTPLTAIVELRTADGAHRGDLFDANRLQANVRIDGKPVSPQPTMIRRSPGVWFYTYAPPPGLGGSRATFGASFDGAPIVAPKTLPVAPDRWTALYPSHAMGSGCRTSSSGQAPPWSIAFALLGLALILRRR